MIIREGEGGKGGLIARPRVPSACVFIRQYKHTQGVSVPKMRGQELLRQNRLLHLYDWGKRSIADEEMLETIALHRLVNQAEEEFGVSYQTALNYARIVMARLKLEYKRELMG